MLGTHPDIAFSVIKMSQFSSNPSEEYLQKALYIVRYLLGTKDLCITYDGASGSGFVAYSDTDWVETWKLIVTILFLGSTLFLISSFCAISPFLGSLSYTYHHYLLILGPLTFTICALYVMIPSQGHHF